MKYGSVAVRVVEASTSTLQQGMEIAEATLARSNANIREVNEL
jgi:hypothetical protein